MSLVPGTCKISELGGIGLASSQTYNPMTPLEYGVTMDASGLSAWETKACTGGYSAATATAPKSRNMSNKECN